MMSICYLDASALVKLVVPETESAALRVELADLEPLVSSRLGAAEFRRACAAFDQGAGADVDAVLKRLALVDVSSAILETAARLEPRSLRTLDAIHLATALSLGPESVELITYDARMARAARQHGLRVRSPR